MVPDLAEGAVVVAEGTVHDALADARCVEREEGVVFHEVLLVACEEAEEGEDEGCGAEQRGDEGGGTHGCALRWMAGVYVCICMYMGGEAKQGQPRGKSNKTQSTQDKTIKTKHPANKRILPSYISTSPHSSDQRNVTRQASATVARCANLLCAPVPTCRRSSASSPDAAHQQGRVDVELAGRVVWLGWACVLVCDACLLAAPRQRH